MTLHDYDTDSKFPDSKFQVHTHHEGVLFAVTAYENPGNLVKQLRSIAANTRQLGMQWINLHGSEITIETIETIKA